MRSSNEGSSFSGLFTRVEMGHIVLSQRSWFADSSHLTLHRASKKMICGFPCLHTSARTGLQRETRLRAATGSPFSVVVLLNGGYSRHEARVLSGAPSTTVSMQLA